MFRGAPFAANLDALADKHITESRLSQPHISAKGNLEGHCFGDFDKIKLISETVGYQQRSILVVDLNNSAGNFEILVRAFSLRRSKRKRAEQREGRDDRCKSRDSSHDQSPLFRPSAIKLGARSEGFGLAPSG